MAMKRADVAKKRFIVRQVLIFGGLSSLLGISSVYSRHFGWHLGFDLFFLLRAVGVLVSQIVIWYLLSLWMWSRTPQILERKRKETVRRT
jgi:hypothetical protein